MQMFGCARFEETWHLLWGFMQFHKQMIPVCSILVYEIKATFDDSYIFIQCTKLINIDQTCTNMLIVRSFAPCSPLARWCRIHGIHFLPGLALTSSPATRILSRNGRTIVWPWFSLNHKYFQWFSMILIECDICDRIIENHWESMQYKPLATSPQHTSGWSRIFTAHQMFGQHHYRNSTITDYNYRCNYALWYYLSLSLYIHALLMSVRHSN